MLLMVTLMVLQIIVLLPMTMAKQKTMLVIITMMHHMNNLQICRHNLMMNAPKQTSHCFQQLKFTVENIIGIIEISNFEMKEKIRKLLAMVQVFEDSNHALDTEFGEKLVQDLIKVEIIFATLLRKLKGNCMTLIKHLQMLTVIDKTCRRLRKWSCERRDPLFWTSNKQTWLS